MAGRKRDRSAGGLRASAAGRRRGTREVEAVDEAAIARFGRLEAVGEADDRRLFDTNFRGVVDGSLAASR